MKRCSLQIRAGMAEWIKFIAQISTHLLTMLIISVILHVEQRKGIKRERSIEIPGKVPKEVFNSSVYK